MTMGKSTRGAFLLIAVAGLLCCRVVYAADPPAEIMPVSEVRAGMKGYGLTTLEGARIDRFDVEVLAVLRGWAPKANIVLVRMAGDTIDEAGIIAGMSGSPVYIDGRLLGAVAYGFYYCTIPLAGVTPAEEMMALCEMDERAVAATADQKKARYRQALQQRAREVSELLSASRRRDAAGDYVLRTAMSRLLVMPASQGAGSELTVGNIPESVRTALPEGVGSFMSPLPVPLSVSARGMGRQGELFPLLRSAGLFPVQATAPAPDSNRTPVELAAGAPVGVALITGDLDISAMGTVTMVDGDRVLALGHPTGMAAAGDVDLPMALGRAETVVPSLRSSFRIGSTDRIIGRVSQNRTTGILGRLGEDSPMFPCTVTVKGAASESYNLEIANYWELCPLLTSYAIASSISQLEGDGGFCTLTVDSEISLEGRDRTISYRNVFPSLSFVEPVSTLVALPLEILMINPFEEVQVDRVRFNIEIERGFDSAWIESVRVNQRSVEPGGKLRLWVELLKFRGEREVREVELEVPADVQPGSRATITVCDAGTSLARRISRDPGFLAPRDFDGMIEVLNYTESTKSLYVWGSFLKTGLRFDGEAMPNLPASVMNMVQFGNQVGLTDPLVTETTTETQMPYVVEGAQEVQIFISPTHPGVGRQY